MRTWRSLVLAGCAAAVVVGCGGAKPAAVETHARHRVAASEMTHAFHVLSRVFRDCHRIRVAAARHDPDLQRLLRKADADGLAVPDLGTRTRRPSPVVWHGRKVRFREPRCTRRGTLLMGLAPG
jgi:hypothetical protein